MPGRGSQAGSFLSRLPFPERRCECVRSRPGPATSAAELVEVVDPSPQRIIPKCVHYGVCGGCHYQHLPYSVQLNAKTEIVRDQLMRIGKIEDPPLQPIVPSPQEWNYRNNVQFHLTREGKVGYINLKGWNVMAIRECHLPENPLNELWPRLEFDPASGLERVSLRLGAAGETSHAVGIGIP